MSERREALARFASRNGIHRSDQSQERQRSESDYTDSPPRGGSKEFDDTFLFPVIPEPPRVGIIEISAGDVQQGKEEEKNGGMNPLFLGDSDHSSSSDEEDPAEEGGRSPWKSTPELESYGSNFISVTSAGFAFGVPLLLVLTALTLISVQAPTEGTVVGFLALVYCLGLPITLPVLRKCTLLDSDALSDDGEDGSMAPGVR